MGRLEGKVALISGGARGQGAAEARAFVEEGAKVVFGDIIDENGYEVEAEINKTSEASKYIHLDVTNEADWVSAINTTVTTFGKLNVLINNAAKDPKVKKDAGLTPETRFEVMTEEYWKEGIDAIINGTFLCSQAAANKMLTHGGGVIVNISSDLGVIAPDQRLYRKEGVEEEQQNVKPITYSAAKWAVIGMTKYLATYYASRGIRVNALSPSGIYNDHPEDFNKKLSSIIPMGRMSHIDEYKGAIMFLCSDASSYMTGENLIIDGGKTVW